jgi:hypothetical protein
MTRRQLSKRIRIVVAILAGMGILAFLLKTNLMPSLSTRQESKWYGFGEDVFPLVVAVLATLLASWFQRRSIFIESLRRLWSGMIEAKIDLKDYARRRDRSEERYVQALGAISRSIDEVRGVYRNVGESDSAIGLFPYEPLHDMRKTLEGLGCEPYDKEASARSVEALDQAWNALRYRFLAEFDTPEPTSPVTTRGSRDPRRL